MKTGLRRWSGPVVLLASAMANGAEVNWPGVDWPQSTPEAQGLDSAALAGFDQEFAAGTHGYVDGMLIVRNGYVVYEREYEHDYEALFADQDQHRGPYNYYDPDWHPYYRDQPLHTMQSVSKSVTSALVGIAIGRGEIDGADVPIGRYFKAYPAVRDPALWEGMTLRDLLTMTSGISWDESSVTYTDSQNSCAAMEASDDWIGFVRAQPMAAPPGERFVYNSGVTMLLAYLLKQATGMEATDYAEQHLFGPIGIKDYYWKITPTGVPDAEGGLYLHPRDLARFGYLYLHDGVWNGVRLLPEGWVEASMAPAADTGFLGRMYGFQWWLLPYGDDGRFAYAAIGYGGQRLLVLPEYDLLAVFTGWNIYDKPQLSPELILSRVLAAVR